ncbi:MAG: S8 family serine peptidase [Thermoactinospora sp.]|nr:S8 family serine peptidase [Thermoactinospora sp.]
MGKIGAAAMAVAMAASMLACAPASPRSAHTDSYLVFYADQAGARSAVERAGGRFVSDEPKLGYLVAEGDRSLPDELDGDPAVAGVSTDGVIGFAAAVPATLPAAGMPDVSSMTRDGDPAKAEPLARRQWDMKMIGADRANAVQPGSKKVLVGVIDTGVDGKHPDIAPNFNRELSRNFVTDIPKDADGEELDGPCEVKSCKDPVDVDDDGHGTHVAGTIAAPVNGIGIAGVAPNVQIVNLRAGQDSGFFFLKASLDALTYAADIGVDVVNMSYYVDPWLFNCADNQADSKKQRQQQRAIVTGMQRALDYARGKGVTLISALGNGSTDLGHPRSDTGSPNYPPGREKTRRVDNSCINVPAESKGVISVAAVAPSGTKAGYSDYGLEQTDLSAPGGDISDGTGLAVTRSILAPAPEHVLRATGKLDDDGSPNTSEVVRDCAAGPCSYYQYLDGTSMAAPHATGVAALLISRFGKPGQGGLHLDPATVEKYLYGTATQKACPASYPLDHKCEGGKARNGFFGRGVVDAFKAATFQP